MHDLSQRLVLDLYDEDSFCCFDDPLGYAEVHLYDIQPLQRVDRDLRLTHVETGSIQISLVYIPYPDEDDEEEEEKQEEDKDRPGPSITNDHPASKCICRPAFSRRPGLIEIQVTAI